jgi:hypothetical protein
LKGFSFSHVSLGSLLHNHIVYSDSIEHC